MSRGNCIHRSVTGVKCASYQGNFYVSHICAIKQQSECCTPIKPAHNYTKHVHTREKRFTSRRPIIPKLNRVGVVECGGVPMFFAHTSAVGQLVAHLPLKIVSHSRIRSCPEIYPRSFGVL
jgi:hypothetical protein